MITSAFDYALVLAREDGTPLSRQVVAVDWQPAVEWARLVALREGRQLSSIDGARVEPMWHQVMDEPYVGGFRVSLQDEGTSVTCDTEYLRDVAQRSSAALVTRGELVAGESVRYLVMALPSGEGPSRNGRVGFRRDASEKGPEPSAARLGAFLSRATAHGLHGGDDLAVFVPRGVLDEVTSLYRAAGANETGGVLVGHLRRDEGNCALFLEITAQVRASRTEASAVRLTFTAQTWTDVRAALALRRRGELWLGWWHTHPVREWTKREADEGTDGAVSEEPVGGAAERPVSGAFFSADDVALHRTVFSPGYSVGLVVSDLGAGQETFSLFGWREGRVVGRGFHVIEEGS